MKFKQILVLYKRSAYHNYFLERKAFRGKLNKEFMEKELERFRDAHDEHYQGLRTVSRILLSHGIRYDEAYRGRGINYDKYDLIITIGGDGTFLEAARHVKKQVVVGINSAPHHSVGRFCLGNVSQFEKILTRIEENRFKIDYFHRLQLELDRPRVKIDALNDVLIGHSNPAFLCRYYLQLNKIKEEQRSSGIWVSTAVGSSGAIHSAGGKVLASHEMKMQFRTRELYRGKFKKYRLVGGILGPKDNLRITSLMRRGMFFVDGAHVHYPMEYGSNLKISISPNPLRTITL